MDSSKQGIVVDRVAAGLWCRECRCEEIHIDDGEPRAIRCEACGKDWGRFIEEEYRLQWRADITTPERREELARESRKFSAWAKQRDIQYPEVRRVDISDYSDHFDEINRSRGAFERWPELRMLGEGRVLDIGGSCIDSWWFVGSGAERVDQVEISPDSQRLAQRRLDAALRGTGEEWRGRVWFHTVPAEKLPFRDGIFDVVFSRATIHHTTRPVVFDEIHRVLKDGGLMFIIEPWFPKWLYMAMKVSRELRGVDRGTDDPLRRQEIDRLRDVFRKVDWHPYGGGLSVMWDQTLGRLFDRDYGTNGWIDRVDAFVADSMGLGRAYGGKCWIVARK